MRILPRNHDGVNEEWISDKTRFVWDGLRRQRLDKPYIREDGKLRPGKLGRGAWRRCRYSDEGQESCRPRGRSGPGRGGLCAETTDRGQGGTVECRTDGAKLPAGNRSGYVGHGRIEDIDAAQFIMLIGTNPRVEAPVLNARIRKAWSQRAATVGAGR